MIWTKVYAFVCYISMRRLEAVKLDMIKCGIDETATDEGPVDNNRYPWLGVLYYTLYAGMGETRSVTTVALIHEEFVVANSADIGPMPKRAFKEKARVLLGEGWERGGRRVRNYIVHPEYGETINSVALIHLSQPVRNSKIIPLCPPPERIRKPQFWVVKFGNSLDSLKKHVLPMSYVPADTCRTFYIDRSLYESRRRPSFAKCAVSLADKNPCVWGAGAALVKRDPWGRWQLLGLGVHGPGCGAPARFLDMLRYYPWIEDALDKFQRITISQIHKHKYVLRSGVKFGALMQFGDCEAHEKMNLIYRDSVDLTVDQNNLKRIKYNMTIFDTVQYTCVTFELLHASASAEMRVRHFCPRGPSGAACYAYMGSRFDISVDVIFTTDCKLDIRAYGLHINMTLLDIQAWKWEEGTYYEDFRPAPVEYRGPEPWTLFGFEPLDDRMWVPDYDQWSTTPFTYYTTSARYSQKPDDIKVLDYFDFVSTSAIPTTTTKKLKWFSKKTTTTIRPVYWYNHVGNFIVGVASFIWGLFTRLFSWMGVNKKCPVPSVSGTLCDGGKQACGPPDVRWLEAVKLEMVNCGVDDKDTVEEGPVENNQHPWLGVLYYSLYAGLGETRSVTTVALIHKEFVVANSADIGPMPKRAFREKARVLLGEGWERGGRRVRNYIVHPEYGETINSVAIIHLGQPVRNNKIFSICPPPALIRKPQFWVVKFQDRLDSLKKHVLPMADVPAAMCRNFYVGKSLYESRRRPSYVKCAVSLADKNPCVWGAGAALITRDVWGRWQLLGLSVYGPGCGAPARFLDMRRYYPWIEYSLDKFQRITISQIHEHKYVLRSGVAFGSLMRFGDCEAHEKMNLIYRESVDLTVDQNNLKRIKYNMTIFDTVQYTCVTFELLHASASAEMRVRHFCPRGPSGAACYAYMGSRFDISVDVLFTTDCKLDIRAYGLHINMTLLDIQAWKWEEGTYYEDFRPAPVEYRGPEPWTLFGFEPLDDRMWVPDYDQWSTTPFTYYTTSARYSQKPDDIKVLDYFDFVPTSAIPTTTTKKLKWFSKKTTTTKKPMYWYNHVGNWLLGAAKTLWSWISWLFGG